ncbi:thermonuclease family protein [Candidatus Uhrbacteria bacterium]|nr:thermonuclease family protein [Candidatus Uhrbacteria bacterium]
MRLETLLKKPEHRLLGFVAALVAVAAYAVFLILAPVASQTEVPLPSTSSGQDLTKEGSGEVPTVSAETSSTPAVVEANATVLRVIDGDTFVAALDAEPGEWKVRLLGVDTPETVDPRKEVQCMGKEASEFVKGLLTGKRVRLEADPQADERDKYDRLLRNVLLEDGTDVNAYLVRQGYAHAYLSFPLTPERKVELRDVQEQAKADTVGLWDPARCPIE